MKWGNYSTNSIFALSKIKLTFISGMIFRHYKMKDHPSLKEQRWAHRTDSESHRPILGSTVTDLQLRLVTYRLLSKTESMRNHLLHVPCLIDGKTKIEEVKDSLYWAKSLPPPSVYHKLPALWGKQHQGVLSEPRLWVMWPAIDSYRWTN